MKYCPMCKETLSVDKFSLNRKRKDGLQCYCKRCSANSDKFSRDKQKTTFKKVCICGIAFETKSTIKKFCCNECKTKRHNKINNSNKEYRYKYEFKRKFEAKQEEKPNNFKKWTKYDDLILIELRKNKTKWKDIGLHFGRSTESCKTRIKNLKKDKDASKIIK